MSTQHQLDTIQMFQALRGARTQEDLQLVDEDGVPVVSSALFVEVLEGAGLLPRDGRLKDLYAVLEELDCLRKDRGLTIGQFDKVVDSCRNLVFSCLSGELRIPDFAHTLGVHVQLVYDACEGERGGANAAYIPQLATVDPEQFGLSITSVSGQHISIGDSDKTFCIQSCSKPLTYLMALAEHGSEYVHRHVGTEPSGRRFNEMVLKDAPLEGASNRRIPHNPLINSGAIMMCSMIFPGLPQAERLERVMETWRRLTAGAGPNPVGYDDETYRSESATADRNWCLGFMMKESGAFPPCFTNLADTLELYFQICSLTCTTRGMSVMASTLANGGLNPFTGDRVFHADHVRCVLPLMLTCGMYDYSGQWAFDVGVPAKSGVGGCVFMVIPNICGIAVWSPRLDPVGNSVRAVAVAQKLVQTFALHNFEVFSGLSRNKIDLTLRKDTGRISQVSAVLFSAAHGDLVALRSHSGAGMNLHGLCDYDQRTAAHLTAAAGHGHALEFLIQSARSTDGAETAAVDLLSRTDRWGHTPLDDAYQYDASQVQAGLCKPGTSTVVRLLEAIGARRGLSTLPPALASQADRPTTDRNVHQAKATHVIFAAADGDLHALIHLTASGVNVGAVCDYDYRTALHLSASNGHVHVVRYLIAQGARLHATDRFGNTAHADAVREGHNTCAELLMAATAPKAT